MDNQSLAQTVPAAWLYTRIGTFITRLTLFAPVGPRLLDDLIADALARHVPITSSYENLSARPRNVGGRLSGSDTVYVSLHVVNGCVGDRKATHMCEIHRGRA
jgi:hypothetical protein